MEKASSFAESKQDHLDAVSLNSIFGLIKNSNLIAVIRYLRFAAQLLQKDTSVDRWLLAAMLTMHEEISINMIVVIATH